MQLKINYQRDEWVPYDQFYNIKELAKSQYTTIMIRSAIWNNGPFNIIGKKNKKVTLKCLHNPQNPLDKFFK